MRIFLTLLVACGPAPRGGGFATSTPPTAPPAPTTTPPTATTPPAAVCAGAPLVPYVPPVDPCDGRADCVSLAEVGVQWENPDGTVVLGEFTGDGVLDLGTRSGVWPLPAHGEPFAPGCATWQPLFGLPVVDYDGDGVGDMCTSLGEVYVGPLLGVIDGVPDYTVPWCAEADLDGDGTGDFDVFDHGEGVWTLHAGPLATPTSPPALTIAFEDAPLDPALDFCYFDAGFFDNSNDFRYEVADLLGTGQPQILITDLYWWGSGIGGCPHAAPIVAPPGIGPVQDVTSTSNDELIRSMWEIWTTPDVDGDGAPDFAVEKDYAWTIYRGPPTVVDGWIQLTTPLGPFGDVLYLPDLTGDGWPEAYLMEGGDLVIWEGDGVGGAGAEIARVAVGPHTGYGYDAAAGVVVIAGNDHAGLFRPADAIAAN